MFTRNILSSIGVAFGVLMWIAPSLSRAANPSEPRVFDPKGPLLVVVEGTPGPGGDADELRRAIADELHVSVIAPGDENSGRPTRGSDDLAASDQSDVLIVAVDNRRIAMSLRRSPRNLVSRNIPAPSEAAARRKAVALLAGNLARDQVSAIVATPAAAESLSSSGAMPNPATTAMPASTPAVSSTTDHLGLQPPPLATAASIKAAASSDLVSKQIEPGPEAVIATKSAPGQAVNGSPWSITVAAGFTALSLPNQWDGQPTGTTSYAGPSWDTSTHVEIQHNDATARLWGVALEVGSAIHLFGAAAFIGSRLRYKSWFLEASVGLGVEATKGMVGHSSLQYSSVGGLFSTQTLSPETQATIYARGLVTVGLPVTSSLDLVVHVGAHLSATGLEPFLLTTPMIGARYRLP